MEDGEEKRLKDRERTERSILQIHLHLHLHLGLNLVKAGLLCFGLSYLHLTLR
jgi:hypothetical protein